MDDQTATATQPLFCCFRTLLARVCSGFAGAARLARVAQAANAALGLPAAPKPGLNQPTSPSPRCDNYSMLRWHDDEIWEQLREGRLRQPIATD